MRILSLILALAIAATSMGAGELRAAREAEEHACCNSQDTQRDDDHGCGGACLMTCCRTVTVPADSVVTPLDLAGPAARIVLPPLLVNDLGEPQSIFHPPRA